MTEYEKTNICSMTLWYFAENTKKNGVLSEKMTDSLLHRYDMVSCLVYKTYEIWKYCVQ